MPHRHRALALARHGLAVLAVAALFAGCALHRNAGTGDLAIRLAWSGLTDLDLLVLDPDQSCIFFAARSAPSGGLLDVDCNAGSDRVCALPVENVFWERGTAPAGSFFFWTHAHSLVPAEAPVAFQLQVLEGERIAWIYRGEIHRHDEFVGPFEWTVPRGRGRGPIPPGAPGGDAICVQRRSGVLDVPPPPPH